MAVKNDSGILPSNDWISSKWRPMMGVMYMVVCIFDFILFPIAWSVGQALLHTTVTEWDPLTLKGAGLFHMAMGAVLGVAAWSRGQEKITAMNAGLATPPAPPPPPPQPTIDLDVTVANAPQRPPIGNPPPPPPPSN
jgi:hypothetical protein